MSIIAFRERDFNLGDREVRGLTDSGRKGRRADVAEERDDREEMKGGRKKRRTEKKEQRKKNRERREGDFAYIIEVLILWLFGQSY